MLPTFLGNKNTVFIFVENNWIKLYRSKEKLGLNTRITHKNSIKHRTQWVTRYKQLSAENAVYKAEHAVKQWLVFNDNEFEGVRIVQEKYVL